MPDDQRSGWSLWIVAIGATLAGGLLLAAISAFGWLGTRLTLPAIVMIAVVIGITAGVLANRSPGW